MKIIGHRGAKGLAPENTIAGLMKALEHHVDEIEFDVRVTKDHVPVLVHDHSLTDPAGNHLKVAETNYAELKVHKPSLATLAEAIEAVGGKVPLLIEVKPGEPVMPIAKVLNQFLAGGWQADRFLLGSFSQKTLRELHRTVPEVEKVVIELWSGIRAHYRAHRVQTKRISLWNAVLYGWYIRAAQRGGYKLAAWTLNDPSKAKRWARHGLYAVITDYPDRFEK